MRLGGQVRVMAGFGVARVIGWDMAAALALGAARGLSPYLLAEFLPEIEAVMARQANESAGEA